MVNAVSCPDVPVLEKLRSGQLPVDEVEHLARHVEQCDHCVQTLHGLQPHDDTLLQMLPTGGRTSPGSPSKSVSPVLLCTSFAWFRPRPLTLATPHRIRTCHGWISESHVPCVPLRSANQIPTPPVPF